LNKTISHLKDFGYKTFYIRHSLVSDLDPTKASGANTHYQSVVFEYDSENSDYKVSLLNSSPPSQKYTLPINNEEVCRSILTNIAFNAFSSNYSEKLLGNTDVSKHIFSDPNINVITNENRAFLQKGETSCGIQSVENIFYHVCGCMKNVSYRESSPNKKQVDFENFKLHINSPYLLDDQNFCDNNINEEENDISKITGEKWMSQYNELKEFYMTNGNLKIPFRGNEKLSRFLNLNRNKLVEFIGPDNQPIESATVRDRKRIELLQKLGVAWPTIKKPRWNERYQQLVEFLDRNNFDNLSRCSEDPRNRQLSRWVTDQRNILGKYMRDEREQNPNEESERRIALLNRHNFHWPEMRRAQNRR
jgi:hypothetical protein